MCLRLFGVVFYFRRFCVRLTFAPRLAHVMMTFNRALTISERRKAKPDTFLILDDFWTPLTTHKKALSSSPRLASVLKQENGNVDVRTCKLTIKHTNPTNAITRLYFRLLHQSRFHEALHLFIYSHTIKCFLIEGLF